VKPGTLWHRAFKVAELSLFSQVEAYALRELSPSTGTIPR